MKPKKFHLTKISKHLKKPWTPVTITKIDNFVLNIARFENKYHWHNHNKDELFIVLKGRIKIQTKSDAIVLNKGEGVKIPKSIKHCPVAIKPSIVLMFEDSKLKSQDKSKS